ncbi:MULTISPECIES: class II lanthipeptide, LchA2/BrtA2 family [unclassified Streptomyces]|uniref:class II lanthipeptide, LchA2/BrtA2 family n=1 Tax=unclassified Streptomyces TaxID=2593676 RepID=UPI002E356F67|nr:class II lanthipeptide, LchA2/BrtA2 family [Streptomyces sp. NBC_01431]
MQKEDFLGAYDELELIELSEEDAHGGTTTVPCSIAVTTLVSSAACPTTKCSKQC